MSIDLAGGNYQGNFPTGLTATQPTAAGAPICLHFNGAGTLVGPLTSNGRLDGSYCFEGTAANWTMT